MLHTLALSGVKRSRSAPNLNASSFFKTSTSTTPPTSGGSAQREEIFRKFVLYSTLCTLSAHQISEHTSTAAAPGGTRCRVSHR